ncbi:sulfatase [Maribacter ulvicola]|uniref:Iduronate 2-sulfatase n=1 Tax=Maribacter ulvicola TaxID=228959 RepID=A0A1N7ANN2_9FLAO|nr:sulfatase [Maribacter ulvicola]SIR40626.1 iduronate 2-sulfatase [Maribacter ulvicola]
MKFQDIFCIILIGVFFQQRSISQDDEIRKPNVLFIIADDLTTTAISSYGNKVSKTPNIDNLATEGTMYTAAYCQYPVCGPSRASFLTGYYPSATQTYGYVSGRENIGETRETWPQLFKNNGYFTARVSKIYHMGVPGDIELGSNGKDDEASWTERYNSIGPEWKAPGEGELVQNNPDYSKPIRGGNVMTIVKANGGDLIHSDGKTAEKASELIREHKNEPFFLAVGFVRPHVPFVAPKDDFEPYPFNEIELPYNFKEDWEDIPKKGINYVTSENAQMNHEQKQKAVAAYYASVRYMDRQVGKVLRTLKEQGLEQHTIVVFTSDHGFHLGEHEFWMKVSVKEESAKVPLIIKVPGKEPAVCNSLVELLDLYPTVAELADLDYSKHIQGKSLVKTLDNPAYKVRDMAFSVTQDGKTFLLRSKDWAYIQYGKDNIQGIELFDMKKDPKQFTNLALLPEYARKVAYFQKKLKQKLKKVQDNDLEITYN